MSWRNSEQHQFNRRCSLSLWTGLWRTDRSGGLMSVQKVARCQATCSARGSEGDGRWVNLYSDVLSRVVLMRLSSSGGSKSTTFTNH